MAKKIIEYLDEEEHSIINLYVSKVKAKESPESLERETSTFLDKKQSVGMSVT